MNKILGGGDSKG